MADVEVVKPSELFLLDWLSKEDSSAYGECRGRDLDALVSRGYAIVDERPEWMLDGYQRVSLTEAGRRALSEAQSNG